MNYQNIEVPFQGWFVVRELGHGSFGKVYEIHRRLLDIEERSAMKVIHVPSDSDEIRKYLDDGYDRESLRKRYENSRDSVLREYTMMARMKDAANIVRCEDIAVLKDSDGIGSRIFIRMELLTPIRAYPKLQSFNEGEIVRLGCDLCRLLSVCEKMNIVHRDIKPENIMVSAEGDYKLGDFGVARTMEHNTAATRIGTVNYMAPEVFLGKKYGHTADIYSLGLVLYWLMNNRRIPFLSQNSGEFNTDDELSAWNMRIFGNPITRPANGSPGLAAVILKALAYDPNARYQSAQDFKRALESCSHARLSAADTVRSSGNAYGNNPPYPPNAPVTGIPNSAVSRPYVNGQPAVRRERAVQAPLVPRLSLTAKRNITFRAGAGRGTQPAGLARVNTGLTRLGQRLRENTAYILSGEWFRNMTGPFHFEKTDKKKVWFYAAVIAFIISLASSFAPVLTYWESGNYYTFNILSLLQGEDFTNIVLKWYEGTVYWRIDAPTVAILSAVSVLSLILAGVGLITLRKQRPNVRNFHMTLAGLIGTAIPALIILISVPLMGPNFPGELGYGVYPILSPVATLISIFAVYRKRNLVKEEQMKELERRGKIWSAGENDL